MGIDHPLSPAFGSPVPPSPEEGSVASSPDGQMESRAWVEHRVEMTDTLAGIAIKYGVEIADIKRLNNLLSDHQMFALKMLLIPLPGKTPSPVKQNGYTRNAVRKYSSHRMQRKDSTKSYSSIFQDSVAPHKVASCAMNKLQRRCGLPARTGASPDEGTEMAAYSAGDFRSLRSEPFPMALPLASSAASRRSIGSEIGSQKQHGEVSKGQQW